MSQLPSERANEKANDRDDSEEEEVKLVEVKHVDLESFAACSSKQVLQNLCGPVVIDDNNPEQPDYDLVVEYDVTNKPAPCGVGQCTYHRANLSRSLEATYRPAIAAGLQA